MSPNDTPAMSLGRSRADTALPPDLLRQASRRLGVVCLVYASAFLVAGYVPPLIMLLNGVNYFRDVANWLPGVFAIGFALLVFAPSRARAMPAERVLVVGIGFEILGSFGIAFAQYVWLFRGLDYDPLFFRLLSLLGDPEAVQAFRGLGLMTREDFVRVAVGLSGLSWVGVWMVFFSAVIPNPPRRALLSAPGAGELPASSASSAPGAWERSGGRATSSSRPRRR